MITGDKSNEPRISSRTTKDYYVIVEDAEIVGVCSGRDAIACLDAYAKTKNAMKVPDAYAYIYADSSGCHCISLRVVPRMKMAR